MDIKDAYKILQEMPIRGAARNFKLELQRMGVWGRPYVCGIGISGAFVFDLSAKGLSYWWEIHHKFTAYVEGSSADSNRNFHPEHKIIFTADDL